MAKELPEPDNRNKSTPWTVRLKYRGIFDFAGLYKMIANWFMDKAYYLDEPLYKHKVPFPSGAEQEIKLQGWKKVDEYLRYNIKIFIHAYDMRDVEVVKEGQVKKLTYARMFIEIDGWLDFDYQGRFDTPFTLYVRDYMNKMFYWRDLIAIWWDRIYYEVFKLHQCIKEYLEFETIPEPWKENW
jgi:hypothetical protein